MDMLLSVALLGSGRRLENAWADMDADSSYEVIAVR